MKAPIDPAVVAEKLRIMARKKAEREARQQHVSQRAAYTPPRRTSAKGSTSDFNDDPLPLPYPHQEELEKLRLRYLQGTPLPSLTDEGWTRIIKGLRTDYTFRRMHLQTLLKRAGDDTEKVEEIKSKMAVASHKYSILYGMICTYRDYIKRRDEVLTEIENKLKIKTNKATDERG